MSVEELADVVGKVAAVATIGTFFAPVFICWNIIKKKSSKNIDPTPFIGGMAMSILMIKNGILMNDPNIIPVNIFGFLLNLLYFLVYYTYTANTGPLFSMLKKVTLFTGILWGYTMVENEKLVEYRFGVILTLLMFTLVGSPLFSLKEIITAQDASMLPFPMILSGTVVGSLWLVYGLLIDNIFIKVQNVATVILCGIQLALIYKYPKKEDKKTD
ncbi:sugar transporter SWEET1-like [Adelges cooleyi]|uniref:sugar transporter SWEET1-like n=1 Tax=Adelges cooleyi TaxID=133065 RepID=UPI00217F908E|nr:sugar transporter SWEET1-like [Adelges cooleyi]XP_050436274.1 sugar transporter SWEET1-like [Adelges cooleyi]XP_050436282.1 sugar transporter SWEET1-like [Adelges cooleyi]